MKCMLCGATGLLYKAVDPSPDFPDPVCMTCADRNEDRECFLTEQGERLWKELKEKKNERT